MYLLRTGDEGGARNALETSFKLNPHDVVTYNLLEMMDTLDTFITTEQQEIVLRIDKADAPVLQAPALALARRALDTLSKRTSSRRRGRFSSRCSRSTITSPSARRGCRG